MGGGGVFISIENVLIGLKMYDYYFCKIVKYLKLYIWKIQWKIKYRLNFGFVKKN